MSQKQSKKEQFSLNYTIMLLPHSQKKPIHFKTPVWTFGLFFLGILALLGTCLFFAGSRVQLKQVQLEKEQLELEKEILERERKDLAEQKKLAEDENEVLRQARISQEQELKELEQRTRDTIDDLKELVERENQIREELGLPNETSEEENQNTQEDGTRSSQVSETDVLTTGIVPTISRTERTMNFYSIQSELNFLQNSLTQVASQYDQYVNTIEAKKEAEAAEIARRIELRQRIIAYALQFVGNRYVYGGNDPYTGVDCSGFTKYVLSHIAGVYLNRTAASQSTQGRAVSINEARPGDLVFYSNGGRVNHVAIYMGDGRVVHASNERVGIITSNVYYRQPTKIVNVLGD